YEERAYATPARVMATSQTTSTLGNDDVRAIATTGDFIVTGPAGRDSVNATVYFRLHLGLSHTGVATDNSTSASCSFLFDENSAEFVSVVVGDATSGNGSSYGHDALATYSGGGADQVVSLQVAIPVGIPFGINMGVDAASQAAGYGMTDSYVAG